MKKTVKKYLIMSLVCFLIFKIEHRQATAWRGYEAVGGEHLTLLIPVLYALSKDTFKALYQDMKKSVSRSGKISD